VVHLMEVLLDAETDFCVVFALLSLVDQEQESAVPEAILRIAQVRTQARPACSFLDDAFLFLCKPRSMG